MASWAEQIRSGDLRALARAATAVEARKPEADPLLRELFPQTGRATMIGVTGSPGTGKSTLVNALASAARARGTQVGIIAVDPTSPYTGGAILGDRIRMQTHHADPGVFIRSMATRGWLGGVARATLDMALLLDAAGRNLILIETVGVGQDEVEIARLADVTIVVLVPGMGDDVQALKAGIMEIADLFVINKSDQPGADRLEREIRAMQGLAPHKSTLPPVLWTVASEDKGIEPVLETALRRREENIGRNRSVEIWQVRLREMLRDRLLDRLQAADFGSAAKDVAERRSDPYSIIDSWVDTLHVGLQN